MMATQPQLLHVALVEKDVVYTPDDVARDVVNFFKPTGRILEPCAGDGAFLRYLPPDTEWCEIEKGRDFFAYHDKVDWIVSNPPFSNFTKWLEHSFTLADDVVLMLPVWNVFNGWRRVRMIHQFGGIRHLFYLGTYSSIYWGVEGGTPIAAIHFQRGYRGGTFTVFRDSIKSGKVDYGTSRTKT